MTTVGSFEAKTHLSALLERVARGERILITRHGVPVAMLIPPGGPTAGDPRETVQKLKAFGKGKKLKGLSVRQLIEEGRRF
jgi:prevent-host-death family protein